MSVYFQLWSMGGLLAISVMLAKQLLMQGFHPIYLAGLQALGSMLFLSAFGVKGLFGSLGSKFRYYVLASILGFSAPQLLVLYAAEHLGASIIALSYAFPLFLTYLLSSFITKSKLTLKPMLYMLAAFVGSLIYLYKPDVLLFDQQQHSWLLLLVLVPLFLSLANVFRSQFWPVGVPVFHVALLTNLFSFFSYLLVATYVRPTLPMLHNIDISAYLNVGLLMLVSAGGQYLLFSLQKNASPAFVGQTGSITTLLGGGLAYVFFAESYQLSTLFGSLLILLGVMGFSRYQAKATFVKNQQAKQNKCDHLGELS